jgi:hypothetical protein
MLSKLNGKAANAFGKRLLWLSNFSKVFWIGDLNLCFGRHIATVVFSVISSFALSELIKNHF